MKTTTYLLGLGIATTLLVSARPAQACGGCFVPNTDNTVVTGHRMALSISMKQSVLWDQIQYAGKPEEFSWVLPVKKGARVELANDAWFEALDAATSSVVQGPMANCGGGGSSNLGGPFFACGSSDFLTASADSRGYLEPSVTVVHEGTVGPYETVTLAADDPSALEKWLADHAYNLPEDIKPTVAAYVNEGFDFIALRLIPGAGVQAMRPVRVVTPGAVLGLPLRMVAAGTGAETAIKLFVLGEGRYTAKGFENPVLNHDDLVWNYDTQSSNFSTLRTAALAANGGKTFLTSYARQGSLLGAAQDDLGPLAYQIQSEDFSYNRQADSIAAAYFYQGDANGGKVGNVNDCVSAASAAANISKQVVDNCDENGTCSPVGANELAASTFVCGELDDLAVALGGMNAADVWVTRLEANLPRAALSQDLVVEPASAQAFVQHRVFVDKTINDPCASSAAPGGTKGAGTPSLPGGLVGAGLTLAAAAWAVRRRRDFARA